MGNPTGVFSFDQSGTQGPNPLSASSSAGVPYASFLMGAGSSGSLSTTIWPANASWYTGLYAQDDFRVTNRLTLNLGFRWDLDSGVTERYNQLGGIDPTVLNPLSSQIGSNVYGGWVFAGGHGINGRAIRGLDFGELSPRFGFAYQLSKKTVLRGGYGIFFGPAPYSANARMTPGGYSASTPWVATANSITPSNLLTNPFPNGFIPLTGSSQGLLTQLGQALSGAWPSTLVPFYSQSWNLTLQRSIGQSMVLQVAYAGNKATHLPLDAGVVLDQLPPQLLSLGNKLLDQVPNPFYGFISQGVLSLPTVEAGYLLRPNPEFSSVKASWPGWGNSSYNALQVQLERRFSADLSFQIAYSWSKTIGDATNGPSGTNAIRNFYCIACDRSLAQFDQPQRLTANFNYILPIGRGKLLGANWRKWTDALFGGWQLNGIFTVSAGLPLQFSVPVNTSYSFGGNQTPDVKGADPSLGAKRSVSEWFNTSAFSLPASFTFGSMAPISSTLRSDNLVNLDFSVFKTFDIGERMHVQLRGESFNMLNHPEFSAPGTTVGTSLFGVVTGQSNIPRQTQIGIKFLF